MGMVNFWFDQLWFAFLMRDLSMLVFRPLLLLALVFAVSSPVAFAADGERPPNILFCIADDWGWPHAGAYGDAVVNTPVFDGLARQGVLFEHAYISSPSCTPSRGAILTGQFHWRLGGAANLWSIFPDRLDTYPEILAKAGYFVGRTGKAWGPGRPETKNRDLAGKNYKNFATFIEQLDPAKPFCFWLGSSDPHRPYKAGSGKQSGMKIEEVELPACYPDSDVIRSDIADYYFEVQRFDSLVGEALKQLVKIGASENTIVVMTGDHGFPFPRGKSNLYDLGSRVPMVVRWSAKISADRVVTDFVSTTDLAPTFLEAAGLPVDEEMTGRSLMSILSSDAEGRVSKDRDAIVFGKERHVPGQLAPETGGYPSRAIRTDDFLLIRNFHPERWPNGTPDYQQAVIPNAWFADTDNGPTKSYIVNNQDRDEQHRLSYELCFGMRPEIEFYDLRTDAEQVNNVVSLSQYSAQINNLSSRLETVLKESNDPRLLNKGVTEDGINFDDYPYLGGAPKFPRVK
jgi:N-sulfoglucosamine sulfohydrolase